MSRAMATTTTKTDVLDGQQFKELIFMALTWLKANQQLVNSLNVFPVPDGDTGTNMLLTMQAAYNEISGSNEKNIGKMAHTLAQGALMGARGNSGVILSQLWRGFARAMDSLDTMDASVFVKGLVESKATAYKGVVRPVEGTILTVAKDMAIAGEKALAETDDLMTILEKVVEAADISVKHTPELLPILKQAGVVDSGGKGLYIIIEGIYRHLKGLPLDTPISTIIQPLDSMKLDESMEEVEPGQDYEVVIDFRPNETLNLEHFYQELSTMGTSIQVGEGDGIYRMHIHVPLENRYRPIDYTMQIGTITKVFMENLVAQMEEIGSSHRKAEIEFPVVEPGQIAVVTVSPGMGISKIFASLGAANVVQGGQTMNPSTEEILTACENLPTDKIIILPNNKNIVMAAQSCTAMSKKKIFVVPSRSVPQGLSAMLRLDPEGDFDHVTQEMIGALSDVETGEITVATRTAEINGVSVHQGEVIALLNGTLIESSATIEDALFSLLEKANTASRERITLFYGENITKPDVEKLASKISEKYSDHEVEIHEGLQPHYQLILSIE